MSLGLKKVVSHLRNLVLNAKPLTATDLGVYVEKGETAIHIDVDAISRSTGVSVRTVYLSLAALENVGAIVRYNTPKSRIYAVAWTTRGNFIPLEFCYTDLKTLSTVLSRTPYNSAKERIREITVLLKILNCALRTNQSHKLIKNLLDILERQLDIKPTTVTVKKLDTIELLSEALLEQIMAVFTCKNRFFRKLLSSDELNTKVADELGYIFSIYNKKQKTKESTIKRDNITQITATIGFKFKVHNKIQKKNSKNTVKNPQKRPICRQTSNTKMQSILNAWGDAYDAVTRNVFFRHDYRIEKQSPAWFRNRLAAYAEYIQKKSEEFKLPIDIREVFKAVVAYWYVNRRRFKSPPASWWSTHECGEWIIKIVDAYRLLAWKKHEAPSESELAEFDSWIELVQKLAKNRGMADPMKIGHMSLWLYNEWVLYKGMRSFLKVKEDYEKETKLAMIQYDYVMANLRAIQKSKMLSYDGLYGQKARELAWAFTFENEQYHYVDATHKPEWQTQKHLN